MRCKAVRSNLDRLGRQALTPRMRGRIEVHLRVCPDCRQHSARHERLASLLTNLPEPPSVPEGFSERLMAAARQQQAARGTLPGSLWRLRWLRPATPVGWKAGQGAVLVAGLALGVFLGQQTWQSVHRSNPQPAKQADPFAVYELDYLTDAPSGSIAETYLSLMQAPQHDGA